MFHLHQDWTAIFSSRNGEEFSIWLSQKTLIVSLNNINLFLFCNLGNLLCIYCKVTIIAELHPQFPEYFHDNSSARVSQILQPSYLCDMTAAAR